MSIIHSLQDKEKKAVCEIVSENVQFSTKTDFSHAYIKGVTSLSDHLYFHLYVTVFCDGFYVVLKFMSFVIQKYLCIYPLWMLRVCCNIF